MRETPWRQALQQVYLPPEPRNKRDFLERFPRAELSTMRFLFTQAAYLRPWSWLVSVGIFLSALYVTQHYMSHNVWLVSALLPFAALSTVTELNRSARHRMEELELSARFSLKNLLLARLTLLGLGNLVLLSALLPVMVWWSELPLGEMGCFLLAPYCLTSLLCLIISRRFRRGEMAALCTLAAVAVSGLCFLWQELPVMMGHGDSVGVYIVTFLLLALTIWEYRRYLFSGEELVWN